MIFKYEFKIKLGNIVDTFTFQSGDIQIKKMILQINIHRKFTFQSGDIQIKVAAIDAINNKINLHSNLVIFKCVDITNMNKTKC